MFMFKNKVFIFIILITALLSIGIVSAEDSSTLNITDTQESVSLCDELNDEVITSEVDNLNSNSHSDEIKESSNSKSFDDLQTVINNKSDNSNLVLNNDYKYGELSSFSGITINKTNFTIDGQGHTIDGGNYARIFNVTGNDVTLKNLIFINASFDNCGGAIYNTGSQLLISNCTFINNYAYCGGAIFTNGGTSVEITNSEFISNNASIFGGAIAIQKDSTVSITGSTFENCSSIDDAGGAIYAISTDLDVKDSDFINCLANFGGAICSLNSKLSVTNTNFANNLARYEGGAIYKMYGSGSISKSSFTKNTALNGGAIFSDNCTKFEIKNTEFVSNVVSGYGGAIFSNANPKLTLKTVTFNNNKASYKNDLLNQSNFSPIVSSSYNYPLFVYKSSFNGTLPDRYSLVDEGYVTPIQNQLNSGNCWAFAALASLETCILKASNKTFVFSAENMKNLWGMYSAYGWKMETNNGGYLDMELGYLSSWLGPVNLTFDSYSDMSTLSPIFESEIHVQNMYVLPARANYTDNNAIKEAILKYGGVSTSYYHANSYYNSVTYGYYCPVSASSNHAICVVGWDDNYSRNNFNSKPAGDGAFIVKNSWGSWGDNGYFYISYYDKLLFKVGVDNRAFTYILNDTVRYTKNYQYDIAGKTDYLITGNKTIWYQNSFTATGNELIAAVSTYFNTTVDYEISVYVNNVLKITQKGTQETGGYYTIPLNGYVPVNTGDVFKVVVKLTNPKTGYAVVPISEEVSTTRVYYTPGVSYFSLDGTKWTDLYNYNFSAYNHTYKSQVACIKAFTINEMQNTTITLNNLAPNVQELTEIVANVIDSNGKLVMVGNVIFTIGDKSYSVNVSNGTAKINVTFDEIGKCVISAIYQNNTLYKGSTTKKTVDVTKGNVNLTIGVSNTSWGENPIININLASMSGNSITGSVVLKINNKTYNVGVVNGLAIFTVPEILDIGGYQAIVTYSGNEKYNEANNFINFAVSKRVIDMNLTVDKNYRDVTVNVVLSEKLNGNLTLLLDNASYILNYINGTGSYMFNNLDYGNYTITAIFTKDNYESINTSENVEINSIKTILDIDNVNMYYHDGTRFIINLKDIDGNPLTYMNVSISINGMNYIRTTDETGAASMALNLVSGVYNVTTTFNGTSIYMACFANNIVNISSTIKGNDIVKYFRNGTQYYAFVSDSKGSPLANTDVSFNINGVFYTRTTDNSGYAKLSINLNPGEYVVTVINQLTKEESSNKVVVLSKIVDNQNLVKYYKNGSKFYAKVLDDQGNPVNGATVTFNINGVLYYRQSGSDGIASLAINLNPGSYTITTMYSQYEVSNNIEVLPTLKTDDLTMSYQDGSTFKATVVDGNGNPLANKDVTFNVNGVFYTRTTDANGIANLAINLMSGEYIITSIYDGYQTGNKITII